MHTCSISYKLEFSTVLDLHRLLIASCIPVTLDPPSRPSTLDPPTATLDPPTATLEPRPSTSESTFVPSPRLDRPSTLYRPSDFQQPTLEKGMALRFAYIRV
eukprot:2002907-Rhodomonas_salina.4